MAERPAALVLALALAGAVVLAACGGSAAPGAKALRQQATSLESVAAEGSLLAGNAASGRSTGVFLRVHAAELAKVARASAATLARDRTPAARRLAAIGLRVDRELRRLGTSGSARPAQRTLARRLAADAAAISRLGQP